MKFLLRKEAKHERILAYGCGRSYLEYNRDLEKVQSRKKKKELIRRAERLMITEKMPLHEALAELLEWNHKNCTLLVGYLDPDEVLKIVESIGEQKDQSSDDGFLGR